MGKKPVYPLGNLLCDISYKGMLKIFELFPGVDLPMFMKGNVLYVGYEELLTVPDKIYERGTDFIETFFKDRKRTINRLKDYAGMESLNAGNIEDFFKVYVMAMMHMHLRAGFRRRVALRKRGEVIAALPGGIRNILTYMLAMNAPSEENMNSEADTAFSRILGDLSGEEKAFLLNKDEIEVVRILPERYPGLYGELERFLKNYRITRLQRDDWDAPLMWRHVISMIKDALKSGDSSRGGDMVYRGMEGFKLFIESLKPEILKSAPEMDFDEFTRVIMLSEEQSIQVENERQVYQKVLFSMKDKLLSLGALLRERGVLKSGDTLLSHTMEEVTGMVQIADSGAIAAADEKGRDDDIVSSEEIRFMEVHPTNRCNLRNTKACSGICTYDSFHSAAKTLPFNAIERIARYNPEYILIAGGGEPALYDCEGKDFSDFILEMRKYLPDTRMELCTNGVKYIKEECHPEISSIRVSLHGYSEHECAWHAVKSWKNLWRYFTESPIAEIWVTYRINKDNYLEAAHLAEKLWMTWQEKVKEDPVLGKKEFGFKIICEADDREEFVTDPYHASSLDLNMRRLWREKINGIKEAGSGFGKFLADMEDGHLASNFTLPPEIITGIFPQRGTAPCSKCFLAGDYALFAADGDIYPCCIMTAQSKNRYGSVFSDPADIFEARKKLARDAYPACKAGCRLHDTVVGKLVRKRIEEKKRDRALRSDNSRYVINEDRKAYLTYDMKSLGQLKDEGMITRGKYVIWYNPEKLPEQYADILRQYAGLLEREQGVKITIAPFSGERSRFKGSLLAVDYKNADYTGESVIDVDTECGIENYLLRITGILNMAMAIATIPSGTDDKTLMLEYEYIVMFVKQQYHSIMGEEYDLFQKGKTAYENLRCIVLRLPGMYKIDSVEIYQYNNIVKKAL
ncbi:MAG: hypothetical protein ABH883_01780 [Candidatus Omnitrophota bacterium]